MKGRGRRGQTFGAWPSLAVALRGVIWGGPSRREPGGSGEKKLWHGDRAEHGDRADRRGVADGIGGVDKRGGADRRGGGFPVEGSSIVSFVVVFETGMICICHGER